MNLIAYTRRSTDEQEDSQAVQERFAREWCEREGHELVAIYHEIPISGSKSVERRLVLAEIRSMLRMDASKRGFDGLVVWKLDRLFRNPSEQYKWLEILDKAKCTLYSVTETIDRDSASGRFMLHIMMGVAALDREHTGERVYAHNLDRALSGRWPAGLPPLGFTYDKATKLVTANDRAGEAVRVFELFVRYGGNAAATARMLNAEGIPSRDGYAWRNKTVFSLLRSTVYRQQLKYDGRIIDAPELIPRIVPVELTDMVDSLLMPVDNNNRRNSPRKLAFSGFLYCSLCGGRLWVHNCQRRIDGWMCRGRADKLCKGQSVSNRYIDRLMGMAVSSAVSIYRKEIAKAATEKKPKHYNGSSKRKNLEAMKSRVKNLYITGHIDLAEFTARTDEIENQIKSIPNVNVASMVTLKLATEWIENLEENWTTMSDEDKRELMTIINARITVNTGAQPLWIDLYSNLSLNPIRVVYPECRGTKKQSATPDNG
ncbi:MAG: recombinase family protein [Dehalococcoidia bacterium]|jgi:site-specific DNA recombinase